MPFRSSVSRRRNDSRVRSGCQSAGFHRCKSRREPRLSLFWRVLLPSHPRLHWKSTSLRSLTRKCDRHVACGCGGSCPPSRWRRSLSTMTVLRRKHQGLAQRPDRHGFQSVAVLSRVHLCMFVTGPCAYLRVGGEQVGGCIIEFGVCVR